MVGWIGTVVVQNVLSSMLNSHLFDFTEGWIYVAGVGVAAGSVGRIAANIPRQGNDLAASSRAVACLQLTA